MRTGNTGMMNMIHTDTDFEERTIKTVTGSRTDGWWVGWEEGMCFGVPGNSPVEPKPGMVARLYPGERHNMKRGLFLDGQQVYYRTEAEDEKWRDVQMYGADAADWVSRWDAGKTIWSISMGGIGPGYEQAIQVAAVEMVRAMLADGRTWWEGDGDNEQAWRTVRDSVDHATRGILEPIGLSGAQFSQAMHLAAHIYRKGPIVVMHDPQVESRRIQVSRSFPAIAARTP